MSRLTDLQNELRRRFDRPSELLDERMPDGRTVDEVVRERPTIPLGGQPIGGPPPMRIAPSFAGDGAAPVNQSLPPSKAFARPQEAVAVQGAPQTIGDMPAPPPPKPEWMTDQRTGEPHREFYANNPDAVAGATGYRDALEKWKPPKKRSLKTVLKEGVIGAATAIRANPDHPIEAAIGGFGTGAISSAVQPNAITRAFKLNRANQNLEGRMGEAKSLAQTQALQTRPGIQQDVQEEREINNALSQYNRLESYDPDDPADAGLKTYFERRGLGLPKKTKGRNVIANWSNGRLVLTDKVANESRDTTVTDQARTPNAQGLNPNQAATIEARESEGKANRGLRQEAITAANTRAANAQSGANARAATAQAGANARAAGRGAGGRPTVSAANQRKAAELVGKLDNVRARIAAADDKLARDPSDTKAKEARAAAIQYGTQFSGELNALGAGYEAGVDGKNGFPYYKKNGNAPAARSTPRSAVTISEREIRAAGGTDADIADAKRRAGRGEIKLVP